MVTVPSVGQSMPPTRCKSVLLPLPLEPTTATNSPRSMDRVTLSKARKVLSPFP